MRTPPGRVPAPLPDPLPAPLLERALALAGRGRRAVLGIAGPPGAGKSTLAERLVTALGGRAVLVPM
ncbi:ATP-binding protein, partial [Streptomyces clavuligerus]